MIRDMADERRYSRALGMTIRLLRGARTQKELAEASEIPPSTLSKIEQGKQSPRKDTFAKIAGGLGCSVQTLEQRISEYLLEEREQRHASSWDLMDDAALPHRPSAPTRNHKRLMESVDLSGVPESAARRLSNTLGTINIVRSYLDALELDVISLTRELQELADS